MQQLIKNKPALFLGVIATLLTANATFGQPTDGLGLWLKADTGLTLNGSSVSEWADQSGQNRNAAQTSTASQPSLVTSALGKPALRFDGANDFLTFDLPVNDLTGMSIFLVANSTLATGGGGSQAGNAAIFWNETASWGTVYLSPFQNQVNFRFGTTQFGNRHIHPRPSSIGTDYSLTAAIHNDTVDSLYIDGALALEATDKSPALAGNRDIGNLGRGFNNNTYFAGEIAEVLVYTRALSDTERQTVEQYLTSKYFANKLPAVSITSPTNNAAFTAPTDITITADASDTDGTISKVEFFRGSTKLGEATTSPYSITWSNVPPGSYTLTASATDNQGAFKTSAPVLISVNPSGGGGPTFTGLALWLTGDSGLTLNGSSVSAWPDQSGQGRDAVQGAAASQPTLVTTGLGKPGLRFDGANDSLTFTLPVNELTGMTIFLVANSRTAQAGGPFQAAIFWNETASWGTVYLSPFQNQVNFRFGTTQVGNSHNVPRSASIGSDYSITTSIHNETVDSLYVNGALLFEAGDKSPALAGNRDIGSVGGGFNNTYFAGDVLEVLVYARALSDPERQSVEQYLQTKYLSNQLPTVSITSPTDNASFTAPASITITAQAADTDGTISKVEFFRGSTKLGEDTTGPDYSFTWNDVPGGNYALTATATDNAGAYKASSAIQILVTSPSGPPFAGLGLWLKADAGVTLNGSNVSHWADQSGLGRDAVQATVANQPTLVSNGPNGKPTLSFDGIDDFLTFSFPVNGLTGMSIVLVANSTAPAGGGGSQAGNAAIFWNETASWGTVYLSPFQDQINWRFGTTQVGNRQIYVRPTTLGSDYSISTILKNETVDSLYINGELAETQSDKLPSIAGCRDIGNLGRGFNDNTFFAGEIAEVLVYTRALSDAERQVVEQYLKGKYAGRVTDGLQVLYTFSEGSGNTITDSSGTGTPLNLTIANPSAVRWLSGGGLALDSSALLASVDPATKVIDSSKAANEITIEAWIKPANTTQAGPARIVSVSRDSLNRNFTLGQQGADYQTRLRTTATGNNGSNPSVTAAGLASIQLSHVVYTRDAAGAVKFYLNGVAQATSTDTIAEDFSNWDGTMRLALANELTSDRPWLGELHLAAVYSRALTQAEAMQNFSVGAPTTPQVTAPAMSIALSGNTVVIAWPVSAAGFNLQTTDNLTTPNWSLVPGSPVVVGDENTATLQIGGSAGFYRLRK